jgi:DNA-binding LytR/AlgR family response regulator
MEFPKVLMNPVFITILILVLSVSNIHWEKWLRLKYPESAGRITFLSDRHNVTLSVKDILYVESNDTITMIVTRDGARYRNKTPISQWENLLGIEFVRIHRSFLVSRLHISKTDSDTLTLTDGQTLPISRKYRDQIVEK